MKIAVLICRILLGVGFVIFGANILHSFIPHEMPPEGSLPMQFMNVMVPTHWMSMVGLFQLLGGLLVLIGGTAPLGLALLAPVLVNILLFHVCLQEGSGLLPGLVFSALEIFLMYAYRENFRGLLTASAKPS